MRTNYPGHDGAYKKNKESGKSGWDDHKGAAQTIADIEKLYNNLMIPRSGHLLEIGCGAGENIVWFAQRGYSVAGIDISPTAVEWARERVLEEGVRADLHVGDVRTLSCLSDEVFDIVHDGHCMHCIIGTDDRSAVFQSIRRVLKKDGIIVVSSMAGNLSLPSSFSGEFDTDNRCIISKGIITRYIGSPDDIIEEVRCAGFDICYSDFVIDKNDLGGEFGELWLIAKKN